MRTSSSGAGSGFLRFFYVANVGFFVAVGALGWVVEKSVMRMGKLVDVQPF